MKRDLSKMFGIIVSIFSVMTLCQGWQTNSQLHVEKLLYMEREMIDFCESIISLEDIRHGHEDVHDFQQIKQYLAEVRLLNEAAFEDTTRITDDVIGIYVLKKRLVEQWRPVLEHVAQSELLKLYEVMAAKFESLRNVLRWDCDLETARQDIARLHFIHEINAKTLVQGETHPNASWNLDAEDIVQLVQIIDTYEDPKRTLGWIKQGLRKSAEASEEWKALMGIQARIYVRLNRVPEAIGNYEELLALEPERVSLKNNINFLRNHHVPGDETSRYKEPFWYGVCRGDYAKSVSEEGSLRCYDKFVPGNTEVLNIEELHSNPRVLLIRNVVAKSEARYIKEQYSQMAMGKLITDKIYRSRQLTMAHISDDHDWIRKLMSSFRNVTFGDEETRRLDDVIKRVKLSESGPGGEPQPVVTQKHVMKTLVDALPIGQYVLFLNDVAKGGGFAFPGLRLHVPAEEGAVLFWQFKTRHGPVHRQLRQYVECPPILGTQFVARSSILHNYFLDWINF